MIVLPSSVKFTPTQRNKKKRRRTFELEEATLGKDATPSSDKKTITTNVAPLTSDSSPGNPSKRSRLAEVADDSGG